MIVSDASPLIILAKVRKLSLLRALFEKVVIEEEVKREAIDRGKEEGAPDALIIENAIKEGWIVGREVARTMGLKVRGSLYVLKKVVEEGLMSKEEAIKTLDDMVNNDFRISTRIYANFLDDV